MKNIQFEVCMAMLVLIIVNVSAFSSGNAEKQLMIKQGERARLVEYVENMRDSVQLLTIGYYALKQRNVDQRESDRAEFEKLRERQERVVAEIAHLREDGLSKNQKLEEDLKILAQKQDEIKGLAAAVDEFYKKEAEGIIESFPIDREVRRRDFESVRASGNLRNDPGASVNALLNYRMRFLSAGETLSVTRQMVYPDDGEPRMLKIARFGNLCAYGADTAGNYYIIRQTGRLGSAKYAVEKIASAELTGYLMKSFPEWLRSNRISGNVLLDVLQNDQSRQLVSGKRESTWESLYHSLEKGGLVMIPMAMLLFWALCLFVIKSSQLFLRGRGIAKIYRKTIGFIDKGEYDRVLVATGSGTGIMSDILRTAIERRSEERQVAERWIRDLIMQELPVLSRGINTMAVIAGAAPLLGLLGTISGMITLFAAVTHHGTGDPKFLAGGISEALITAKTGLAIAIPALFAHDFLRNAKDRLAAKIEQYAIRTMNHIWPKE